MLWFLSFFTEFRNLQISCARMEETTVEALKRASQAERCEALQADTIVSLQQALKGAEGVADFFCQRVTGKKMYEQLPTLPENAAGPQPVYKQRRQARELVHEGNIDFANELREMMERQQRQAQQNSPASSQLAAMIPQQ